jgi:high-affinity nickel permease
MFGLDDHIANLSDGTTLLVVVLVALLLGLRHASDPDHLAAVTTLVAGGKERSGRVASRLGAAWGLGHATTLFAFGVPIVLYESYLPEPVQQGSETFVGILIVTLAVWLIVRWRRGIFHLHVHEHAGARHLHVEEGGASHRHAHDHGPTARSPIQAFGIGLAHGLGGSAGVGVLLLATVDDRGLAVGALAILAVFTAVSMTLLTTAFGLVLGSPPVRRTFNGLAPMLGLLSFAFGIWYALGALQLAPYLL